MTKFTARETRNHVIWIDSFGRELNELLIWQFTSPLKKICTYIYISILTRDNISLLEKKKEKGGSANIPVIVLFVCFSFVYFEVSVPYTTRGGYTKGGN